MKDQERGLYRKYDVKRVGDPVGKHDHCKYFVLDLTHDKHAIRALHRYVYSCESEFPQLARDLRTLLTELGETP